MEPVECLAAHAAPVDEQDQVVLLLHSLPTSFKGLVLVYLAKGEVWMAELHEALFNHEAQLLSGGDNSSSYSGSSALAFRVGHSGNFGGYMP